MKTEFPTTLLEAVRYFSDLDVCVEFLAEQRWPDGTTCPHCESKEVYYIRTRRIFKCKACRKQFSVKVGTIFEDSHIGLDKWMPAMWMATCMRNGVSSWELSRTLGVTQKTAWYMLGRIRLAMQMAGEGKLKGEVEADETFIGGKARNMHKDRKKAIIRGRGFSGKQIVMGLLERKGHAKACIIPETVTETMQAHVKAHVERGAELFTDAHAGYRGLSEDYAHAVVDHAEAYVNGKVHTNGLENFWSLLKRTLSGTYVSVEPFHLFRYLDEQTFRFNNRQCNDAERFVKAVRNVTGKRLTYSDLIGAEQAQ